jgi:DNA primase
MSMPLTKDTTPFAYEYMTGRGFTEAEIEKYNIKVGREFNDYHSGRVIRKWSGRVLFPFMTPDNIMEYVIGRSINGKDPKYVNQRKDKSGIVYNLYNVTGNKCILCEGVISALAAQRVSGIPSIAVLGKYMTDTQIYKIRQKADEIIYSFDGDVDFKTVRANIRKLLKAGFTVQYLRLPQDQDPDSLGKDFQKYVDSPLSPHFLKESYEYGHS